MLDEFEHKITKAAQRMEHPQQKHTNGIVGEHQTLKIIDKPDKKVEYTLQAPPTPKTPKTPLTPKTPKISPKKPINMSKPAALLMRNCLRSIIRKYF